MNHYDNPEFFAAYAQMSRSQQGLDGAGEWHLLQPLFPDMTGKDVLDLGCGTGRMTLELASRGYDMTGVDSSVEMLNIARDVSDRKKYGKNILWLCQNMCDFELYGTVEVAVSCLDCINHLTTNKAVQKCFDLVHNYLSPDGLFIFDINGKNKFENFYSNNSYVFEEQGSFCTWQNYYNGKNHVCDFYITVFVENEYGLYERFDDVQKEKMYTLDTIKRLLSASGFEFIGAYKDFACRW